MGNSQSSHFPPLSSAPSSPPGTPNRRPFERKRSAILSRIGLGCTFVESSDSLTPSHATSKTSDEKFIVIDHRHRPPSSIYPLAYTPTSSNVESDEEAAFASFVRQYPGQYSMNFWSQFVYSFWLDRIPIDLDIGHFTANWLCPTGTRWGNICRLYGRRYLPRKSRQSSYWFPQAQYFGQHSFCQQQVNICALSLF